ncbi:hypothetical protein SAMN05892877_1522 [Rhizobium subbaraonis]|uniref:Uncharacterized protein n=1 Tax=Rhizobium subbaraonis TaxID=908946 RepID=A0A285V315_9HYPH|nr:hypothetical protein SAMN05892877_1522 [Rhizobium subbaraonis]
MNYRKQESLVPPDLLQVLLEPAVRAGIALTSLDERIARSRVGQGWMERRHFTDACDVMRTRRRIFGQSADWALSPDEVRTLRQTSEVGTPGVVRAAASIAIDAEGEGDDTDDAQDLPGIGIGAGIS